MKAFNEYSTWDWRFGKTPDFKNSLEKKFDWALVDFQFDVQNGVITEGKCFSDCLVPNYIDGVNEILGSGEVTYDVDGIKKMCSDLHVKFEGDDTLKGYTEDLENWLII